MPLHLLRSAERVSSSMFGLWGGFAAIPFVAALPGILEVIDLVDETEEVVGKAGSVSAEVFLVAVKRESSSP